MFHESCFNKRDVLEILGIDDTTLTSQRVIIYPRFKSVRLKSHNMDYSTAYIVLVLRRAVDPNGAGDFTTRILILQYQY
jgi:hypothetical protein